MVAGQVIVIILLTAVTAFTSLQTLRSSLVVWKKTVFITLRAALLLLLVICLTEPSFAIKRFSPRNTPLPVLVDASASMDIFDAGAPLAIIDSCIKASGSKSSRQRPFTVFLFGDSIRKYDPSKRFSATDRRSFFPAMSAFRELSASNELLVISDGFWSNSSTVNSDLSDKSIWYVPLSPLRQQPFLMAAAPDTIQCAAGLPGTFYLRAEGRLPESTTVTVTLSKDTKPVFIDSVIVGPGGFSHVFKVPLPPVTAGLHLYKAVVASAHDPFLSDMRQFLCHAYPQSFCYTVISDTPSLDIRFLKGALYSNSFYTTCKDQSNKKQDIAFIFGNGNLHAPQSINAALAVYMGYPPGKTFRHELTLPYRMVSENRYHFNPFSDMQFSNLPPVSTLHINENVFPSSTLVSCICGSDTFPLVYQYRYRDHPVIICSFDNFWQWDFLPLSHSSGETDAFPFTRRLIAAAADLLQSLQTDTLLIFPAAQPVEISPLQLYGIFPQAATQGEKQSMHFVIENSSGKKAVDTTIFIPEYHSLLTTLQFPPLPSGSYAANCSLHNGNRTRVHTFQFNVTPDRSELLVNSQNEAFLQELGQPVNPADARQIDMLMQHFSAAIYEHPLSERIFLQRSWILMGLLFLFLLGEWTLRRIVSLD